jgi:Rrf2 family protein
MKISTKGRYGLRALIDLAISNDKGYVSLADISDRQDLSLNYLESIFANLKHAGLVIGMAGAQGGYVLSKPAKNITLFDILTVLEGDMSVYDNVGDETKIRSFLNRNVWDAVDENVNQILTQTTLEDVIDEIEIQNLSAGCSEL